MDGYSGWIEVLGCDTPQRRGKYHICSSRVGQRPVSETSTNQNMVGHRAEVDQTVCQESFGVAISVFGLVGRCGGGQIMGQALLHHKYPVIYELFSPLITKETMVKHCD